MFDTFTKKCTRNYTAAYTSTFAISEAQDEMLHSAAFLA